MHFRAALLASCVAFGCSDDGADADDTSTSTSDTTQGTDTTGTDGTGSTDGTGTDTTDGTTDTTDGTTDTTDTTDTGTGTDTTDTGGDVMVSLEITGLKLFQNCQPVVPPDPLTASWTLAVTNDGAADVGGMVDAARVLDQGDQELASIGFSPAAIPDVAPNQTTPVQMMKTANSLQPSNGCATVPCNSTATLELDLTIGGEAFVVEASASVECVF